MGPIGIAFPIVRVDVHSESAKASKESIALEIALVVEGLTQLFSNDRVFLDPGPKEATDLGDT